MSILLMIWPLQGTGLAPRLWAWRADGDANAAGSSRNLKPRDLNVSSAIAQSLSESRPHRRNVSARAVAVSATSDIRPGNPHRLRLNSTYIISLENAGLIPLVVPPLRSDAAARDIVSRVDGLVLTGGEDVEPALYGQPRSAKCGRSNESRDRTEIALIRAARELRKPVLAICRGPQVLNVALGGTLIQDIPSEVAGALDHDSRDDRTARVHEVAIDAGSRIADALGATNVTVNSLHHQAINDLAPGLRITARAPDGIVEGVESDDDWWVMAVQWHPEEMNDSPEPWDRGLFKALADRLGKE